LGRKTGAGFYAYDDGKMVEEPEAPAPSYDGRKVWVSQAEADGHAMVTAYLRDASATIDTGAQPGVESLILVTPVGDDATTTALDQGLDPTRTVAVDTVVGFDMRRTLMTTPVTDPTYRMAAHAVMAMDDVPATVVRDGPGFVAQRIIAMICNVGCSVAQFGIASPEDIDKAVTLGLNYPYGPLGFGDKIGPDKILQILEGVYGLTRDPRYRPNPWLTRRAKLGVSLLTSDAYE
jgi:3-hydroxybutyryl-CoA dehydrogenase